MAVVTFTVSYTVQSEPAVSAVFTPAAGPFYSPLAAGTLVGTVTVTPSSWMGLFTPSGPQAGDVAFVATSTPGLYNVVTVGSQGIASYSIPQAVSP